MKNAGAGKAKGVCREIGVIILLTRRDDERTVRRVIIWAAIRMAGNAVRYSSICAGPGGCKARTWVYGDIKLRLIIIEVDDILERVQPDRIATEALRAVGDIRLATCQLCSGTGLRIDESKVRLLTSVDRILDVTLVNKLRVYPYSTVIGSGWVLIITDYMSLKMSSETRRNVSIGCRVVEGKLCFLTSVYSVLNLPSIDTLNR